MVGTWVLSSPKALEHGRHFGWDMGAQFSERTRTWASIMVGTWVLYSANALECLTPKVTGSRPKLQD